MGIRGKLDGYRALLLKDGSRLQIRCRNDKDLTRMYPTVATAAQRMKADSVLLDGEIVALGPDGKPSVQALQHRGSNPGHQVVFYAFYVLQVNGRDIMSEPLVKRRAKLPAILGDNQTIRLSQVGSAAFYVGGSWVACRASSLFNVATAREFPAVEIELCAAFTLDRVHLYSCIGRCPYVHE